MRKILLSLLMSITLLCNTSISVYASDFGGSGSSRTDLSGFDNWSLTEKMNFWGYQFEQIVLHVCGLASADPSALQIALESMWDELLLEDCTYEEWITTRLGVRQNESTGEYELIVDNELADLIYNASVQYIEEETGFFVYKSADANALFKQNVQSFPTYSQYSALLELIKENSTSVFMFDKYFKFSNRVHPTDSSITLSNCISFYIVDIKNIDLLGTYNAYSRAYNIQPIDKNWENANVQQYYLDDKGDLYPASNNSFNCACWLYGKDVGNSVYRYYSYETPPIIDGLNSVEFSITSSCFLASYGEMELRLYKSLDYIKQYSVGQRPYYVTETFTNYDSTIDNSTTITQTEIDNSVTYGDVYNYIINNYDNSDGLTEDELRAILEEYLSQINNSGGSGGSGSGSGDSGGSGGGLSGFLDGLGSIGNAILAILGKLMEILGSAIELVTGAITDLITIIPNSIGELLGALFPVFPEEWIKAITLSLVLGVIVGIVRMFK